MESIKVLIVATSHDKMGDTDASTGIWLEEMAAPYYIFQEAGADITIASPNGGQVPIDPKSLGIIIATRNTKRFLKDEEAMNFLSRAVSLSSINADDFDLVFLSGGHGSLWDLADNKILKQLLEVFENSGKPIGAVCHGVAGLLTLKNDKGNLLIKGRQLTGRSNSEEESAGVTTILPFLLETELLSLGAMYSKGDSYVNYVVADGNIITGQNPASAVEVAKRVIALVKHKQSTP